MDNPEADEVHAALEALTALQRESDHRVKNNLQLIASLLQLQARRAPDDAVRQALKSIQQRLAAVSAAQRQVQRRDGHEWVAADGVVRDVVADLAAGAGRDDIRIELRADPLVIPARDGAALALIVNELVANALKHGCGPSAARVAVELTGEAAAYHLAVTDGGFEGGSSDQRPGVGMTICQLLAQQLRGVLQVEPAGQGRRAVLSVTAQAQPAKAAE